jgi:hypothetical protein
VSCRHRRIQFRVPTRADLRQHRPR